LPFTPLDEATGGMPAGALREALRPVFVLDLHPETCITNHKTVRILA
jgi:hypothetical protein